MGAPSINIAFIEKSASAVQRGERGVVALLLKEATVTKADFTVYSAMDIPEWLSDSNKEQLEMALRGYQNTPKKILVHVISGEETDGYTKALEHLETLKWNYLAVPPAEEDNKTEMIAAWIKSQRTSNKRTFKAVLPNLESDQEGIVNVANGCKKNDKEYSAAQMCARVAGIICGTPISISCTYAPLPEMTDCDKLGKGQLDEAVDSGKFVFMWDGEKVKVCRGITSLVTTTDRKGESFKKIKIMDAMDMIYDDIEITIQDHYTGKYTNSYDNKCVLITAINGYFAGLVRDGILSAGSCQIDIDAQRGYLMGKGGVVLLDGEEKKVEDCTDEEVKRANTGSQVFLRASISIHDAMEDFDLDIYIG